MPTKRIPKSALVDWWHEHGIGLCAEAQSDGVPCVSVGRDCETCEHAVQAWLAAHPDSAAGDYGADRPFGAYPECGP